MHINNINSFLSYLEYERRFSAHTIGAYKKDLYQFHDYCRENYTFVNADNIKLAHIRSWSVQLMQEGISSRSIGRKLSALRSFFKFLKYKGIIVINPAIGLKNPKTPKRLASHIPEKDLKQLFSKAIFSDSFEGYRDRAILEMIYATGIRRSELIRLENDDISFEEQQMKVKGKGNKERILPMLPELIKCMKEYILIRNETFPEINTAAFYVSSKGLRMYPKLVYNIVVRYLSMISTSSKRSPHVLRHSFATHLVESGAELNAVKELLGHTSLAATQIYTHNSIEELKKVYSLAHPKGEK